MHNVDGQEYSLVSTSMPYKTPLFVSLITLAIFVAPVVGASEITRSEVLKALEKQQDVDHQRQSLCPRSACCMNLLARFDDAQLKDILNALSKAVGVPIVVELDVDVSQRLTISEGNVTVDELITLVLDRLDLTWFMQGDYVIVRRTGWDL